MASHIEYRRDLDGLRAVAVIPVVLFHAGLRALPGGFVGVDIFFVLSGYLIASIILRDVDSGRFSIANFYERRFRRILPALTVLVLVSIVIAHVLLLPEQLTSFGMSVVATALFGSNIFFWQTSGYFSPATEWLPLVHTWSLSVEEQYYIFFPLLIYWSKRLWSRNAGFVLICVILAASFALNVWASPRIPAAAFYLTPTRAWELLLGAALVYLGRTPLLDRRWVREACAGLGLTLIVAAFLFINSSTVFPGYAALAPCLGALLIIATGAQGQSGVSRLLSSTPLVAIGLISYSLYLWHWPIFSFLRLSLGTIELPFWYAVAATLASLAVSALSWRYVERPFRIKGAFTRAQIFKFAASATAVLVASGGAIYGLRGLPARFSPEILTIAASARDNNPLLADCPPAAFGGGCVFGSTDGAPARYAVWGDSHAMALQPAIQKALNSKAAGILYWNNGCPALYGAAMAKNPSRASCVAYNKEVLSRLTAKESPVDVVFLSGRWVYYAEGTMPAVGGSLFEGIADADGISANPTESRVIFEKALMKTVSSLRASGKQVVIFGPTPEFKLRVAESLALSKRWGRLSGISLPSKEYTDNVKYVRAILTRVAAKTGATYIDFGDRFCGEAECKITYRERPLFFDTNHLTFFATREFVAPFLAPTFRNLGVAPGEKADR